MFRNDSHTTLGSTMSEHFDDPRDSQQPSRTVSRNASLASMSNALGASQLNNPLRRQDSDMSVDTVIGGHSLTWDSALKSYPSLRQRPLPSNSPSERDRQAPIIVAMTRMSQESIRRPNPNFVEDPAAAQASPPRSLEEALPRQLPRRISRLSSLNSVSMSSVVTEPDERSQTHPSVGILTPPTPIPSALSLIEETPEPHVSSAPSTPTTTTSELPEPVADDNVQTLVESTVSSEPEPSPSRTVEPTHSVYSFGVHREDVPGVTAALRQCGLYTTSVKSKKPAESTLQRAFSYCITASRNRAKVEKSLQEDADQDDQGPRRKAATHGSGSEIPQPQDPTRLMVPSVKPKKRVAVATESSKSRETASSVPLDEPQPEVYYHAPPATQVQKPRRHIQPQSSTRAFAFVFFFVLLVLCMLFGII